MEKERGLKKKTALSMCILQLYLCTSVLIFAADKHAQSLFTLMPSLSPSLVFTLSFRNRTGYFPQPLHPITEAVLNYNEGSRNAGEQYLFAVIVPTPYACCL